MRAAAAIYAEALAARPRDAGFRVRLASSLKQLERYEEALAVLAEGLALTPGAADLLSEQVAVLQQSGQLDAAGAKVAALAEQHPGSSEIAVAAGKSRNRAEGLCRGRRDLCRGLGGAAPRRRVPRPIGKQPQAARAL